MRAQQTVLRLLAGLLAAGWASAGAEELSIQSFNAAGQLVFGALNNGTNYNYRVEWAPAPSGPWLTFDGVRVWLDTIQPEAGHSVTSAVPMCYRVVATLGDYLAVDLSGGTHAATYPVTYYRTIADVPGGPNSDTYKNTQLLLRLIPKGVFVMGSPATEAGRTAAEVQHVVTLTKDFYIGVFEVTQRQWELVMGNKPSFYSNAVCYAARPVESVSYYDIRENPANSDDAAVDWPNNRAVNPNSFMGRLRAKSGVATFDLPTEAQWEYACRSGTTASLNSGKDLTAFNSYCPNMAEVGRYWFNGGNLFNNPSVGTTGATAKVGSYLLNTRGLYDLHGNVYEWCADWQGPYAGTCSDPMGPPSGTYRVIRGGGWYYAEYCRSASRDAGGMSTRNYSIGFRVAADQP